MALTVTSTPQPLRCLPLLSCLFFPLHVSAGAFLCTLHKWDRQQHVSFRDIMDVSIAQIPVASIGRWTMRGVTGRIMEWWGSDVVCATGDALHAPPGPQMIPKRAAYFGDYSFDAMSAEGRGPLPDRFVRAVVIQTRQGGNIALTFDDDASVSGDIRDSTGTRPSSFAADRRLFEYLSILYQ